MSMKEMVFKIEKLSNEMEKVHSLQNTLFEAIYKGDNDVSIYEWAFVALGDLTFSTLGELTELTNKAFELLRNSSDEKAA